MFASGQGYSERHSSSGNTFVRSINLLLRWSVMTHPLVATKFFVPKPRDGALPRYRLSERLNRGVNCKLTLVSAPAGFGKTAALAAWLATRAAEDRHVAWLSLDEADNDVLSFWTHVIAAVQHAVTGFQQVSRPGNQPIGVVLTGLLNALAGFEGVLDLVLDDFHVVNQPDIPKGVGFLLEHLPPHIHIIISTRADPALPLARLRARGELMEIRST
jgi:LuxR family maltose regulon positive regulatory protein